MNDHIAPTFEDYHRRNELQYLNQLHSRSTLGAGMCPMCGRPVHRCSCIEDHIEENQRQQAQGRQRGESSCAVYRCRRADRNSDR